MWYKYYVSGIFVNIPGRYRIKKHDKKMFKLNLDANYFQSTEYSRNITELKPSKREK